MKKRVVSILLAVLMIAGIMPLSALVAFAAEPVTKYHYLEVGEGAYIDTNYTPKSNTRVVFDAEVSDCFTGAVLFGVDFHANDADYSFYVNAGHDYTVGVDKNVYGSGWGTGGAGISWGWNGIPFLPGRQIVELRPGQFKSGDAVKTYEGIDFAASDLPMYLFAINFFGNEINTFTNQLIRFYSCRIYEGNALVRDFVPAKQGEKFGVYDEEQGTFYEMKGTGTVSAYAEPYDRVGAGTENDPWKISTLAQLEDLANAVSSGNAMQGKYFLLTADIDRFTKVIGKNDARFNGHFDGQGRTVTLDIDKPNSHHVGLFSSVDPSAVICNVNTAGTVKGESCVGGVCALNNGTISNCRNSAAVNAVVNDAGGICGYNFSGTVINCHNSGAVNASIDAGGICGYNYERRVSNCYNSADVSGGERVGGISGGNFLGGRISNCYNSGKATGNTDVGAICGRNTDATVSDCYYDNQVHTGAAGSGIGLSTAQMQASSGTAGALVDRLNGYREGGAYPANFHEWKAVEGNYPRLYSPLDGEGTQEDPFVITKLFELDELADEVNGGDDRSGVYYILGADLDGFNKVIGAPDAPFKGHFDGRGHTLTLHIDMPDDDYVGLFGFAASGAVICNVNTAGTVTGKGCVGGVCGYNEEGAVSNCHSSAEVKGSSLFVGGICGVNGDTICNCGNTSAVSGTNVVGGVCGYNSGAVSNSRNTAAVSGNNAVGGVCGYNAYGTVSNCYSSGTAIITPEDPFSIKGAICALNDEETGIDSCYYDSEVYIGDAGGGIGLSAAQMKAPSGTDGALIDLLNGYTDESGSYPVEFMKWIRDDSGYPIVLEGRGTQDEPYVMSTLAQLCALANQVNGGDDQSGVYYALGADIDGFNKVIGTSDRKFKGHFDGKGYTVTLKIDLPDTDYAGLFGYNEGTVCNVNTAGTVAADSCVGGICGQNDGAIYNCSNGAAVSGNGNNVGGICGVNSGTVINCYNCAEVTGDGNVGGICGSYMELSDISGCYYDNEVYTGFAGGGTGLSTAQMKAPTGTDGALVDRLNLLILDLSGAAAGTPVWDVKTNEYPGFVPFGLIKLDDMTDYATATDCYTLLGSGYALEWKGTVPAGVTVENNMLSTSASTPAGTYTFRLTSGRYTSADYTVTVAKIEYDQKIVDFCCATGVAELPADPDGVQYQTNAGGVTISGNTVRFAKNAPSEVIITVSSTNYRDYTFKIAVHPDNTFASGTYRFQNTVFDKPVVIDGDVEFILADGAAFEAKAGILLAAGNTLAIRAESTGENMGKLLARGDRGAAGIGGDFWDYDAGDLIVYGGEILAGGGFGGDGGNVTICGGIVRAKAGYRETVGQGGSGIGGGYGGNGGTLTINEVQVLEASGFRALGAGEELSEDPADALTASITVAPALTLRSGEDEASVTSADASTDMPCAAVLHLGELDGDGEVGIADLAILAKYLAGWDVDPRLACADLNAAGGVDVADLTLLAKSLAGWDVSFQ